MLFKHRLLRASVSLCCMICTLVSLLNLIITSVTMHLTRAVSYLQKGNSENSFSFFTCNILEKKIYTIFI